MGTYPIFSKVFPDAGGMFEVGEMTASGSATDEGDFKSSR
jgi:hypothetical protein